MLAMGSVREGTSASCGVVVVERVLRVAKATRRGAEVSARVAEVQRNAGGFTSSAPAVTPVSRSKFTTSESKP